MRARKRYGPEDVCRKFYQLQWGRALAGAETFSKTLGIAESKAASMGPRPCGRGNASGRGPLRCRYALLQWGRALAGAETRSPACGPCSRCRSLQWGRALAGAETTRRRHTGDSAILLQWGRALAGAETRTRIRAPRGPCRRFNGAAPLRARKQGAPGHDGGHLHASMGPRPCGRGNESMESSLPVSAVLQWGRALAGAETRCANRKDRLLPHASMGPRPCGRGNPFAARPACPCPTCFNGAAPLRARKRGMNQRWKKVPGLLQWGRALAGAETS